MVGAYIRLKRLFPEGEGVIVLPIDHGEFQGPRKGLVDPLATLQALTGYDAVLLSPGMLVRCRDFFAARRQVIAIVRLNWNADYCSQWGYSDGTHGRILSPAGALALGADVGLASVAMGTGDPAKDAASAELFGRLAEEARHAGLPLGGEFYPGGDIGRFSQDEFHDLVLRSARIIAELGADFIKTFYTGERFQEVVEACPVPVIVLGAEKENEVSALRKAELSIAAGARGVIFGRNVFESDRPQDFLNALGEVVRRRRPAEAVAEQFGFTALCFGR
jgi:DhnA family fructose-bisphosphate aldolase class Ia